MINDEVENDLSPEAAEALLAYASFMALSSQFNNEEWTENNYHPREW